MVHRVKYGHGQYPVFSATISYTKNDWNVKNVSESCFAIEYIPSCNNNRHNLMRSVHQFLIAFVNAFFASETEIECFYFRILKPH